MKNVLITGCAGFIGLNLATRLLEEGYAVTGVDNYLSGSSSNIEMLEKRSGFHFIEQDVTLPICPKDRPDWIFNLACPASPKHYQADPVHTMKTSVLGAVNVLDLARESGAVVLQASTSEIYGEPLIHPQPESYRGNVNPYGIRACYDEGKRAAEALFFDYYRQYGTNIRVIRIFNTYGPYMLEDDGRVVSNFITQALNNEDITLYGDGSQTRSFCYISDLVDAMILVMKKEGFTGPVNLGNPEEIPVKELAHLILEMTESPARIKTQALPEDDPTQRCPDITLAKEVLGWEPKVDLRTGVAATIEYFRMKLHR